MEAVIVTLVVIGLFFVLFSISFYPFVKGFRFLNKRVQVNLGPYSNKINSIKEKNVKVKVKDYPDVEIIFNYPGKKDDKLPVIMFIHGGGWIGGSAKKINSFTKLLASNGFVVANIEYSLAPEYQYPVSTIQLVEALNYIYENSDKYKINKDKIFIGGTSAGAHLSSQLGCLISNDKYQEKLGVGVRVPSSSIKGLLLINGVYNFETVGDCHFPGMKGFIWSYVGDKDYLDYDRIEELSTIKYVNKDFPSVFITAGDKDPLRTQSYELVEVLKKKKIDYKERFFEDKNLLHDYIYLLNQEESQKTYEEIVKYLIDRC